MLERVRQWGYFASYYLGSLVGQRRPLLGGMKLTRECNLNCLHCPYRRRARESISFDRAATSLNALHECDVTITRAKANAAGVTDPDDLCKCIRPETALIVMTHASNVTGAIQPIE